MIKEGKIGVVESICLIVVMNATSLLYSGAREVVDLAGTAGWLLHLIAASAGLLGFMFILLLMRRFPGQDLISVFETVFGRLAGNFVSFIISLIFFFNAVLFTREFVEAVKIYDYPLSPPSFMMVFFILAIITMLYFGFETIARMSGFFAFFLLIGIIAIFLFAIPFYRICYLFPMLGQGLAEIIPNGLKRSSVYGNVLALTVVINSLQGMEHLKKTGIKATVISGLILSSGFFFYNLVFPYYIAVENTIPLLAVTRIVEYGRFFQRFESIFLFTWSISAILAAGINLYMVLSIYCKIFRMDDHRPLLLPLIVIFFTCSLLPPDISSMAFMYVPFLRHFGAIFYFGLPLLALLVAAGRGKKGGPPADA